MKYNKQTFSHTGHIERLCDSLVLALAEEDEMLELTSEIS